MAEHRNLVRSAVRDAAAPPAQASGLRRAWRPPALAWSALGWVCLTASLSPAGRAAAQQLPKVRVASLRRVFHNGEHNAFTDLCYFRGRFYLTFRSCPDGHGVYPSASIIVLSSPDAGTWEQLYRFRVPQRDTRDPHFLVFQNKLFVYTGTWYCGDGPPKVRELNKHLGYGVWTADGRTWSDPEMLEGTYGHYVWRAATWGGKAYLCGRRKHEFAETEGLPREIIESVMLESEDGLIWRKAALFREHYGNETAFVFEADGSVLAVARGGPGNAQLCRAPPPYVAWERKDLGRNIGGPVLARWGDRYVVGGRNTVGGPPRTALYWLADGELHEMIELPSGGDNSYPGFLPLDPGRALVSYYSSHEKDGKGKTITAIYLAELELNDGS